MAIEVGDHVLVKNLETVGPGKLRLFWEQKLCVVIEKLKDIPVYVLKPLEGERRVKRIHRNLIKK